MTKVQAQWEYYVYSKTGIMLPKTKEPLEGRLGTRMNPFLDFKGTMALTNTLISGFYPLDLRQQTVKALNLWSIITAIPGKQYRYYDK